MLITADARRLPLVDGCVQCVVTSPPYWGLRDYGHAGQIGLEPTFEAYIEQILEVFREVWRVLRSDGTCWVNLGDSYNTRTTAGSKPSPDTDVGYWQKSDQLGRPRIKTKDLCMIPARVALALQAAGWYLRADIIWHKPNPMPESVTDRPTKSHEYLFLLTKAERYVYDADAIKEPSNYPDDDRKLRAAETQKRWPSSDVAGIRGGSAIYCTRNKRSVWTIPTMPYAGAHFATMPEALVEPCILAGCPLGGLVLDPFVGSGTVGAVAERLGRRWVGTDLSYHRLAAARTAQRGLRWHDAPIAAVPCA